MWSSRVKISHLSFRESEIWITSISLHFPKINLKLYFLTTPINLVFEDINPSAPTKYCFSLIHREYQKSTIQLGGKKQMAGGKGGGGGSKGGGGGGGKGGGGGSKGGSGGAAVAVGLQSLPAGTVSRRE